MYSMYWLIFGVILLVIIFTVIKYNGIIKLKNVRKQSFADIDVQLKLRFDLVPNLVSTVKGYMIHEKDTLESVTLARTKFLNSGNDIDSKLQANDSLTNSLKTIFAVAEKYPELKSNTNFLELQKELSDIENKIAASRRFFNNSTQEYNTYIEMFPNNIIAGIFNFKEEKSYSIEDVLERDNVKVEF